MAVLPIVIAPDPVLSTKSIKVEKVDKETLQTISDIKDTIIKHQAMGIAANMVGIAKRIIVINTNEGKEPNLLAMVNPEILSSSEEQQTIEEASLSYPFISAPIARSKKVEIQYLDEAGKQQKITLEGFTSTVAQHEMDYLEGKSFLDHLSKLKKDMLLKKMKKMVRVR